MHCAIGNRKYKVDGGGVENEFHNFRFNQHGWELYVLQILNLGLCYESPPSLARWLLDD